MVEAVYIHTDKDGTDWGDLTIADMYINLDKYGLKDGDKVKLIIVKED